MGAKNKQTSPPTPRPGRRTHGGAREWGSERERPVFPTLFPSPPPPSLPLSVKPDVKKDFSTAILERKKSPNRLVVDDATNDDNR